MNITLVRLPFGSYASKQPSLGLAYLAAVLKGKGANVSVIDADAEGLDKNGTFERIMGTNPAIVGFTVPTSVLGTALDLAKQVKAVNKDIKTLAGGPHPSVKSDDVVRGVDIVVRGEGEETMAELYDYFEGKMTLESIKGISYMDGEKIVNNPDRPFVKDLNKLSLPAWEYFPLEKYRGTVRKTDFNLPILTSRGCPYGCSFCSVRTIWGRCWRPRSAESVVDELEYLIKNFKIKEFTILDDNFTVDPERAMKICDLILERGLKIPWCPANGIRVDTASVELFKKMKEAGCYRLYFGVESGNQEILNKISKNITLDQIRTAFRMAKEAGMETTAFFMIGNIGENEKTIQQSIDFAIELDPDFVQFTIATPYPGTDMYREIEKNGKFLLKDWADFACFKGAIFEHGELTAELINKMHKKAVRSFYWRPKFILKYIGKNHSPSQIKNLILGGFTTLRMMKK